MILNLDINPRKLIVCGFHSSADHGLTEWCDAGFVSGLTVNHIC